MRCTVQGHRSLQNAVQPHLISSRIADLVKVAAKLLVVVMVVIAAVMAGSDASHVYMTVGQCLVPAITGLKPSLQGLSRYIYAPLIFFFSPGHVDMVHSPPICLLRYGMEMCQGGFVEIAGSERYLG